MLIGIALDQSIDEKVKAIVAEVARELGLGKPGATITAQTSFSLDLRANGLDKLELILALEEEFKIKITEAEGRRLLTVQDAIDTIFWIATNGDLDELVRADTRSFLAIIQSPSRRGISSIKGGQA